MRLLLRQCTVFFALMFCVNEGAAQWTGDSLAELHVRKGIDFVYNIEFDSARAHFRTVIRLHPNHPSGYFFLAMVEWWRILLDIDNKAHDEKFYRMLDGVIAMCDKRLKQNANDVTALFFKGGSLGFRGRLRANRGEWLKAANDGRRALPIVQRAFQLEPNNYDVLLGMGIYNYYAAVIPEHYPVVKPLMVFFPPGDKMKGISQLHQAQEKALYADIETQYFLVSLYYSYEKEYSQALSLALDLHKRFPNNPVFQRYVGRCYLTLNMWEEMYSVWNNVLLRVQKRQYGYDARAEREAQYYIALYKMNVGDYEEALKHFYRCDELSRTLDKDGPSGFMVLTNLKIGHIYDMQEKRHYAIKQYDKVLQWKEYQDSHKQARQYKKTPYGKF